MFNIGWRYLLRHPWQTALMILGIALGVAVIVAIDLANASASRAFDLSTDTIAGRATHQIVSGPSGVDENLYVDLLRGGVLPAAAPVVSEYVSSPQLGGILFQLLGIDAFVDASFRSYLGGQGSARAPIGDLTAFLTQPGAVLLSQETARRYNLVVGQPLTLDIGGRTQTATLVGLLQPGDALSRRGLENLILADIATAQEFTARTGRLDRIDLILPAGASLPGGLESQISALLPPGVQLQTVAARTGTIAEMTTAFRLNLTALSLLALVVGLFLIYNTMTFSIVQRRPMFGTLRCLGVTRREVFILVIVESFLVGLTGALLGAVLGVLMGQGAVQLVAQTINDLFFVVSVRGVQIPVESVVKGMLIGLVATLLAAAPPAWEAASVPPRSALSRSGLEGKARQAVLLAAAAGAALLVSGIALLIIPTTSLVISFAGTFAVLVGIAMLAPAFTGMMMRLVTGPLGRLWGSLGRMAPRDVVNSISRTSIAIAALMVAISVSIGVSLMVGSFRSTVIAWLDQTLSGDVYISAPSQTASSTSAPVLPEALQIVSSHPAVQTTLTLRAARVDSPNGMLQIAASSNPEVGSERSYVYLAVPVDQLAQALANGAVLVSEPLANRLGMLGQDLIQRPPAQLDALSINTDSGERQFTVAGVYYDYSSTTGTVLMSLDTYRRYWQDQAITAVALRLKPGQDSTLVSRELRSSLAGVQNLLVRPNQDLRSEVLVVFDRTFAITGALQLLATIVAFIGILSTLLSLELERQRELGILRSIGLTLRQMWGLIMLETGLMGGVAGLMALPTGYILALILIYIINRRSFGWTLQMQVPPEPFIQALLLAIFAALLAGIYPAVRMARMPVSEALHSE